MVMAPEMPNKVTAHGPMQHKPTNDAKELNPIAPPVVAAVVLFKSVDMSVFTFLFQSF